MSPWRMVPAMALPVTSARTVSSVSGHRIVNSTRFPVTDPATEAVSPPAVVVPPMEAPLCCRLNWNGNPSLEDPDHRPVTSTDGAASPPPPPVTSGEKHRQDHQQTDPHGTDHSPIHGMASFLRLNCESAEPADRAGSDPAPSGAVSKLDPGGGKTIEYGNYCRTDGLGALRASRPDSSARSPG